MQKRILGKTGIECSVVGIGAWQMGGADTENGVGHGWSGSDDQESISLIHKAEELGVNLIDTADIYGNGHSECVIARALNGRRDRWIIATKGGLVKDPNKRGQYFDGSASHIAAAIDASLERLNTDYIDYYQLHGMPTAEDLPDTMCVLINAQQAGKVRYFGISTDNPQCIDDMHKHTAIDIVQLATNITQHEHKGLAYCAEHQIPTFIRSPLAWGKAFGKYAKQVPDFPFGDVRHGVDKERIKQEHTQGLAYAFLWAQETGRSPVQAVLRYLIDLPGVSAVIPGTKNIKHLLDSVGAGSCAEISESEWQQIADTRAVTV